MKDGQLVYSLHIHVNLYTVRYHPTRPCCKDLWQVAKFQLSISSNSYTLFLSLFFIFFPFFFFSFFFVFWSILKKLALTDLEKKTSFGMNSCNKILVMTCLLHYFHFVRLLSNFISKITSNYELWISGGKRNKPHIFSWTYL